MTRAMRYRWDIVRENRQNWSSLSVVSPNSTFNDSFLCFDVEDLFDVSESIIGITLEDIREQFQLWMEGKITRTEVEYWSDRRNTCFHHYDDVEFYPIEKEDLYQKWIEILSMFVLGGEGDYFYTDEGLKRMYYELCEDIKKADEKFEQEIKKIYK